MKYDIFISCKSEDYESAKLIYKYLCDCNYKVFLADTELRKKGNAEYGKVIDDALDSADHFVLFASRPEYIISSYVESEWRIFIEEKRTGRKSGNLISILDGIDISQLPISLRHFQSFIMDKYTDIIDYLPQKKSSTNSDDLINNLNNILSVDILADEIYVDFKEKYSTKQSLYVLNHIKYAIEKIILDIKNNGRKLKHSEFLAIIRECINKNAIQTENETVTLVLETIKEHCISASERIGGLIFSSYFSHEYNEIRTDIFKMSNEDSILNASIVSDSVLDKLKNNINQSDFDLIFAMGISSVGLVARPIFTPIAIIAYTAKKLIEKFIINDEIITLQEVLEVYKKYDTDDTIVSALKEKFESIIDNNDDIKEQITEIVKSYCDDCKQKLFKIGISSF